MWVGWGAGRRGTGEMVNEGKGGKKGAGGKGGGKANAEEEEEARESLVQELLRVADRFQAGGCTSTVWRSLGGR